MLMASEHTRMRFCLRSSLLSIQLDLLLCLAVVTERFIAGDYMIQGDFEICRAPSRSDDCGLCMLHRHLQVGIWALLAAPAVG